MNKKILPILPQIERRLGDNDIIAFKIGKTSNTDERFLDDDYNAYDYAIVVAMSNDSTDISILEADMIQYFSTHLTLKYKCENKKGGSAGNPDATSVYIVAKGRTDTDDLSPQLKHLMDKAELLDIKTIEL